MSEIPADVIEAANAAFKRDEHDNTLIGIVARAILAERKRCAQIVEWNEDVSVRSADREILAAAIRAEA